MANITLEEAKNKLEQSRIIYEKKMHEQEEILEKIQDTVRNLAFSTTYSENVGKMVSSITHEVRNPLAIVKGYLQLIKEQTLDPKIDLYVTIALNEITRANDLITHFLTYSKPKEDSIETISINQLIYDIHTLFSSQAILKNILLDMDLTKSNTTLLGNKNKLTQTLVNLIQNSFESFETSNNTGSHIISLSTTCDKNNINIFITDNGCGMKDEQLKTLFSPFKTTKKNGTGMGLYLCKKILESMGGTIQVESKTGKGTTFTLTMPKTTNQLDGKI
ncbi:MAG TPA: HAMP domain-containing sensor histidine kinase [Niallia sp.]|nr:HAMP domain-containing sensor histidine kinase [Niallia sp.]